MKNKYDVIIIGAGIAGMTAAIYLKRFSMNVLIIEKEYPGGQLAKINTIENYPGIKKTSGFDLATTIYEQVKELEIPVVFEEVIAIQNQGKIKEVMTKENSYQANYLVLATGRTHKKLGLPLEKELVGHGISYCATCDGPLYKDQEVFVLGGGDSALQEAIYLASICKKVNIIHRRDTFRASEDLIKKVENHEKISIFYNSVINTLCEENGIFTGIEIIQNDEKIMKKGSALFIYIGMEVENKIYAPLEICQENGYIIVDKNNETNVKGIYACGDLINKEAYQLVTASAEGANAAIALHKAYIKN